MASPLSLPALVLREMHEGAATMKPYKRREMPAPNKQRATRQSKLSSNHRCWICDNRDKIEATPDGMWLAGYKGKPCSYKKKMGLPV